ncbi:MAG: HEAT repeat domain-containing protein, partial [Gammaproteobacteria bacterium]|nr:HEAT repeat domain-containing protein [Gammaproteobacteria bacterium]
ENIVKEYTSRGLILLGPETLGVPPKLHESIFRQEVEAYRAKERITAEVIPDILQITNAPGVREACETLLGENYAIVPFTHNTPFMSGSNDQHWHKDDNGPYNMRKQRHHQAVQLEMLYYPQAVKADMGPTATVPYSQYWTFNHEENHDNFAGADHLDFGYQINGMERVPISGKNSEYSLEDIVNQETAHDKRMRKAVSDLDWPHCQPFEVGPLAAGSVVLYSHNLLHRGNHRRDDWRTWKENPRFMWRFWLFRTTEPKRSETFLPTKWQGSQEDVLTRQSLESIHADTTAVWDYQFRWMRQGEQQVAGASSSDETKNVADLALQLRLKGDSNEPARIGAAYRLARHTARRQAISELARALHDDRENVRRAALYGLISVGVDASPVLLDAVDSPARWVRKAAAFGLGSAGAMTIQVVKALGERLLNDDSTYVRSVAADALGCLGRRIVAYSSNPQALMSKCADLLLQSLTQEVNRLSMDRAQQRSIKMVRPHDDCDVCEGIGFDYGQARYEPVRSVVRENALWAMVILASHGADKFGDELNHVVLAMQHVIEQDKNVFSVGLAMDVLERLASIHTNNRDVKVQHLQQLIKGVFAKTPIYSLEALVASGMSIEFAASEYARRSLTMT